MTQKKTKFSVVTGDKDIQPDGRRQRSERSRKKILQSLWDLMIEGNMEPSAAMIAERASVGLRSVFRHFEDMDTISRELVLLAESQIMPLYWEPLTSTYWKDQLLEAVERSSNIWNKAQIPIISGGIRRFKSDVVMNDYKRLRIKELAGLQAILPKEIPNYDTILMALDNAYSFESWRRLHVDRGLSLERVNEITRHTVQALIAHLD